MPWRYNGAAILILGLLYLDFILHKKKKKTNNTKLSVWVSHGKSCFLLCQLHPSLTTSSTILEIQVTDPVDKKREAAMAWRCRNIFMFLPASGKLGSNIYLGWSTKDHLASETKWNIEGRTGGKDSGFRGQMGHIQEDSELSLDRLNWRGLSSKVGRWGWHSGERLRELWSREMAAIS